MTEGPAIPFVLFAAATIFAAAAGVNSHAEDQDAKAVADLKASIREHLNDRRATVEIVTRAWRQSMAPEAATEYHFWLRRMPQSLGAEMGYVLSYSFAEGGPDEYPVRDDKTQRLRCALLSQQLDEAKVTSKLSRVAGHSPECLLTLALPMFWDAMYSGSVRAAPAQERKALAYLRSAVHMAPKWADTHFWLGYLLTLQPFNWKEPPSVSQAEALRELQTAEKLDPVWHPNCLAGYQGAYYFGLKRPDLSYAALEEWLKYRPNRRKEMEGWREELAKEAKAYMKAHHSP